MTDHTRAAVRQFSAHHGTTHEQKAFVTREQETAAALAHYAPQTMNVMQERIAVLERENSLLRAGLKALGRQADAILVQAKLRGKL